MSPDSRCGILVFSLCVFVSVSVETLEKTDNVLTNNGIKKFYLSLDQANFFEAFVHCKQGGMQLASIGNEDESADLDQFLDPYKIVGSPNGFWLSGTNLIDTSTFQYYWLSTGARTVFTNWVPNQPDNAHGTEHCMQWVYANYSMSKPIGWNDYNCNYTTRYVCEYISID